jgi:hypothetical protein
MKMMTLQEAQIISCNGYNEHAVATFDLAEHKLHDAGDTAAAARCKRKAARARRENTAKYEDAAKRAGWIYVHPSWQRPATQEEKERFPGDKSTPDDGLCHATSAEVACRHDGIDLTSTP